SCRRSPTWGGPDMGVTHVSIGGALFGGLRRLRGQRWLVLPVWLTSLSVSAFAALPLLFGLHAVLDRRPLAETLARGESDFVWREILADHRTLVPMAATGLLSALLLTWLSGALLTGGLIGALRHPPTGEGGAQGGPFLLAARRGFGRMLRVSL